MQILVLIAIALTQVTPLLARPATSWALLAAAGGAYLLGQVALAVVMAASARRGLRRSLQNRLGLCARVWLLGGLAGLGLAGLRGAILSALPLENIPLAVDALMLLPFAVAMVVYWLGEYPPYRRARLSGPAGRYWTRRQYIEYNLRHHVLIIALPVGLIVLLGDTGRLVLGPMVEDIPAGELILVAWSLASIGGVFLLAPLLIRLIWRTKRLAPGPLRNTLEDLCRRMNVGTADILIWQSDDVLANAAAMGLHRRVRFLLLSDGLLATLPPEQLRAIFAHEIAHIQQKHILYSGLFALAAALWSSAIGWGLTEAIRAIAPLARLLGRAGLGGEDLELYLTLLPLAAIWLWGFGFISRRFERQCDVIGAWASGPGRPPADPHQTDIDPAGAECFASSLEQVALLNGLSLHRPNWRHGSMASRIDYLHRLVQRRIGRWEIDRIVRRIRMALWVAVALGGAMAALRIALPA
jgi:STE24 endopeptidase